MFHFITNLWYTYGWFFLLAGAIVILCFCWIFSDKKDLTGTYNIYELVREPSKKKHYFPQSISSGFDKNYSNEVNYLNSPHSSRDPFRKSSRIPTESKGEAICRQTLQNIFNAPFPKVRPDFLFNSVTGENLEFDMYNKDYKLAVEYNGQQHYKYNSFMHGGSKDKFYAQQYRDNMKKEICKKLGIRLIEVPYTVSHRDIPQFLIDKLKSYGYIE